MKKIIAILMGSMLVLALAACGEKDNVDIKNSQQPAASSNVQIPNPIEEKESLEQAANQLGFSIELAEKIEPQKVRIINGELLDVTAERDGVILNLRKAKGKDDISGDYTQYPEEKQVLLSAENKIELDNETCENPKEDEKLIVLKGAEGKMKLAVWNYQGFTYSVHLEEDGIVWEEMCDLVNEIN